MDEAKPVVVAFDGSSESERALRAAATLFRGHPLLVVSVWEPGLAAVMTTPDAAGMYPGGSVFAYPDAQQIEAVDHIHHDHAGAVAEAGAAIARELGADARALPVQDSEGVADTVVAVAEEHDAIALAIGARGRGTLRSLFGSTSRRLLHESRRPVLVVRADH